MPLQYRVDPFGNLIRTAARGAMIGNRGGALHNAGREIVRSYKSRRWIACVLEFRGRYRIVMSPNRYTELFSSPGTGHVPSAGRERYNAFREAWRCQNKQTSLLFADEMDLELHPLRIDKERIKSPIRQH